MLGNGLFGVYNPASVWADDSAIFFDGVNDYVYIDCNTLVNLAGKNTTTLSLWFKADESPEANFLIWQHKETSGSNDANQYLWYDGVVNKLNSLEQILMETTVQRVYIIGTR